MKFPFGSNPWLGLAVGVVLGIPLGYAIKNPRLGILAGSILGIPVGFFANYLYGKSQQKKLGQKVRWSFTSGAAEAKYEGLTESEQSGQSAMLEVVRLMTSVQQAPQLPGHNDTETGRQFLKP